MNKLIFSLIVITILNLIACGEQSIKDNIIEEKFIIEEQSESVINENPETNQESKKVKEIPQKYKIWKTNIRTQVSDNGMSKLGTGYLFWYKKSKKIIIDEGVKSDYNGGEEYDHKTELIIIDEYIELPDSPFEKAIFKKIDKFEAHYPNDVIIWKLSLIHFNSGEYHFFINGGDMYWDYYLRDTE